MNPILLYTNNLVDIINIPLEGGGFTKDFYICEKNTNNSGYFINGFKNIKDFAQMFLAPLVTSVVLDIINDKNIQNEYKQILFSARDGYLPLQVYNIFAKNINIVVV